MRINVQSGLDCLVRDSFRPLHGARVGLLANQSAVDKTLAHAADLLAVDPRVKLMRLFAPEHGFRGEMQDMEQVNDEVDRRTGLPVISLYGASPESFAPIAEQLQDLEILLVDLPDIGSRYYTFAQTLGLTMRAAAAVGIKVLVLDRPNPINGTSVEGSPLLQACRSFCGYAPVANRHGLTIGELALLMNKGFAAGVDRIEPINCQLEVMRSAGWERGLYSDQTSLAWISPSPNMPTLDTAIVYPGACLLEGTSLSEGRGTTRPFEQFGAPYIDSSEWAGAVFAEGIELKGARLRTVSFRPKFHKYAEQVCFGLQVHVTDREEFHPYRWFLALISSAARLYRQHFSWRKDTYEFVKDVPAIDLLFGSSAFRQAVDSGSDLAPLVAEMERFEAWFAEERKEFFLY